MSAFPQKIPVATDGSADAERATEAASDLTKMAEADLHVVHVWHDVPRFAHDYSRGSSNARGRRSPTSRSRRARGTGAAVAEAHLRGGPTSHEVIALSEEIGAGLLIVGSRGLGTVQRILMGSQPEEIVHHARVPVLVLRREGDSWPPERMVIGEDFSDDSRKAGDLVASIGALYGARALLLYAHPDLPRCRPARRGRRSGTTSRTCAGATRKTCSGVVAS